jgi:2-methylisocitrate lyase-like PEP mutase family enzyme
VDFEGAYSVDPEQGAANVVRLAATGAVGCNFEDQVIGGEGLHPLDLQVAESMPFGMPSAMRSSSTPGRTRF